MLQVRLRQSGLGRRVRMLTVLTLLTFCQVTFQARPASRPAWQAQYHPVHHPLSEDSLGAPTLQQQRQGAPGAPQTKAQEVPSITGQATPPFFAYASEVAVQLVRDNFKTVHLPDAEASASIPVVGHLDIQLTSIKLDELSLKRTRTGLELEPDGTLVLHVTGLDAVVNAKFHFHRSGIGPSFGGSGHAKITVEDGTAKVELRVLNDGAGRPKLLVRRDAELAFGSLSVEISDSSLAWLLNLILKIAQGPIQDAVTKEVKSVITSELPKQVNRLLLGVPTTVDIKGLQLNTSMAGDPMVSAADLQVSDWGRFQSPAGIWEECPYKRVVHPHAARAAPGSMLAADIDQSIVNCLTWVLFQRGLLDRQLEGDDLPGGALWTTTWLLAVPQLPLKYPNRKMAVQVHVLAPPEATVKTKEGFGMEGAANLSFFLAADETTDSSSGQPCTNSTDSSLVDALRLAFDGDEVDSAASRLQGLCPSSHTGSLQGTPLGSFVSSKAAGSKPVGAHLFTLRVAAKLVATQLDLVPDTPDRPDGFRVNVQMALLQDSLAVAVNQSDIGAIDASRLKIMLKLVAALVQEQINDNILAGGIAVPEIPFIQLVKPELAFADGYLALSTTVKYVP